MVPGAFEVAARAFQIAQQVLAQRCARADVNSIEVDVGGDRLEFRQQAGYIHVVNRSSLNRGWRFCGVEIDPRGRRKAARVVSFPLTVVSALGTRAASDIAQMPDIAGL